MKGTNDYPIEMRHEVEAGRFVATQPDLPGCEAEAVTAEDALLKLRKTFENWIQIKMSAALLSASKAVPCRE